MRVSLITATALVGLALAGSAAVAQSNMSNESRKKVFGYQDPVSGEFRPVTAHSEMPEVTTTSPTTGDFVSNFTITLKTAVPTGGKVLCGVTMSGTSINETTGSYLDFTEMAYDYATVSGTTAKCTVSIPYSWLIPAATTTILNTYTADVTAEIVPATATTVLSLVEVRYSGHGIVSNAKIPASGTTTTEAVAITL